MQATHQLIVEIAYNAVFWLNCFPCKDDLHNILSPLTFIMGSKIDFNKHCKLQFETYIQMHEQHNNTLLPRMAGVIKLHPTGNEQGSYYFLSLKRSSKKQLDSTAHASRSNCHSTSTRCNNKKYKGDDEDDEDNIVGNSNDGTVGNSEITGVHGNSNELQRTTEVPQINIEGNTPKDKGNSD